MGLLNWLRGGSKEQSRVAETSDESSTDNDEDDEPDKERPYPVETELFSMDSQITATGGFARTVELVSAVNGQNILIEYDECEQSGRTTSYSAFSSAETSAYKPNAASLEPRFRTDLIELNESNILSRKTLGSYNVSLEQDIVVEVSGVKIVDAVESIPAECRRHGGRPYILDDASWYQDDKNYIVAKGDGPCFTSYGYKESGFTHIEDDGEQQLVYVDSIRVQNKLRESSVEPDGSIPEVIADSIETGTDVMRAVLSDGRVVIPDDEQGIDGDGSDLMRISELASDQ